MRAFALLLAVITAGSALSAQSLADLARKERDRRQTTTESTGKTYTNQDLKQVPEPPAPAADSTPAASSDPADGASPTPTTAADQKPADAADADDRSAAAGSAKPEEGAKDQEYWSKRMTQLREQLDRDQTYLRAMQNRVDSLTTDFVNRDDPAQKSLLAQDRAKALSELDRLQKAVEEDEKAIPELEEEARREGVPAGWLR